MRKYSVRAGSTVRIQFGIALAAALRAEPETQTLAEPVEQVNDRLEAAKEVRVSGHRHVLRAQAALRVAEQRTDRLIRSFSRGLEAEEGGRRGPLYREVFPSGLTAVVAPGGARQLGPAAELVGRLERTAAPGADGLRATWLPRLRAQTAALRDAVVAWEQAEAALEVAFAAEMTLRVEHRRVVDVVGGQVRVTFPDDRARQDALFPSFERSGRSAGERPDEGPPPVPEPEGAPGIPS